MTSRSEKQINVASFHDVLHNTLVEQRGCKMCEGVWCSMCKSHIIQMCNSHNQTHAYTDTRTPKIQMHPQVTQYQHQKSTSETLHSRFYSPHFHNSTKCPPVLAEWLSNSTIKTASFRDLGISHAASYLSGMFPITDGLQRVEVLYILLQLRAGAAMGLFNKPACLFVLDAGWCLFKYLRDSICYGAIEAATQKRW